MDLSPRPPKPRSARRSARRWAPWLLSLAALAGAAWALSQLDLAWLQQQRQAVLALHEGQPWAFGVGWFLVFTALSALALPGCSLLALTAGLCFGFVAGTLLVVLASTVGATLSFLAARHWFRDAVQRRWGRHLAPVQDAVARDGALYLLSLRLAPVLPYALVNPLMGLSRMPTHQFVVVSGLGMLAGSAAYVYAGTALAQAQRWGDLLSPGLLGAIAALAVLPWLARGLVRAAGRALR